MITFEDFANTAGGTLHINWGLAETALGFTLHEGMKSFYSRVLCSQQQNIEGRYFLEESQFSPPPNAEYSTWTELLAGELYFYLYPLQTLDNCENAILSAFTEWTGGYDMGRRARIGSIDASVGEILLLFNNDTGEIEWNDPGYGHFEVYEENPYGIFAEDIEHFLAKLSKRRQNA